MCPEKVLQMKKSMKKELESVIDFSKFIKQVDHIDLTKESFTESEEIKIQAFLLFPFMLVPTSKEIVELRKEDVEYIIIPRGKHVIKITTPYEIISVVINQYMKLYEDVFKAWQSRLQTGEYFFMPKKDIKFRYQSFNNMIKKSYPHPIYYDNSEFTKYPIKTLKQKLGTTVNILEDQE